MTGNDKEFPGFSTINWMDMEEEEALGSVTGVLKVIDPNNHEKIAYKKPVWIEEEDLENPQKYLAATNECMGSAIGPLIGANVSKSEFLRNSADDDVPRCVVHEIPKAISYKQAMNEAEHRGQRNTFEAALHDMGPIFVLSVLIVHDDLNSDDILLSQGRFHAIDFASAFDPSNTKVGGDFLNREFYENTFKEAINCIKMNPSTLIEAVKNAKDITDEAIEDFVYSIPDTHATEADRGSRLDFRRFRISSGWGEGPSRRNGIGSPAQSGSRCGTPARGT